LRVSACLKDRWFEFLSAHGANFDNGVVRDFGDAAGELAATVPGNVIADLSHFGVLTASGEDAREFLHAQLSCDVRGLAANAWTYGSYCSPKGRVLANFLLWQESDGFRLLMPGSVIPALQSRLQKFVLRAKVKLADRTAEQVILGLAGADAHGAAGSVIGDAPQAAYAIATDAGKTLIALGAAQLVFVMPAEKAPEIWSRLALTLKSVGTPCWEWLDISHGLPWITDPTQEAFVPQMANLELLGAINFKKGCYPGQEIVARAQYRGEVKRRLRLARVRSDTAPVPGQDLFSDDQVKQSAGTVVNAAPAPEGGFDLLAVVQLEAAASSTVRLGSPIGPVLQFRALPYASP
jgi:folate-binding protein YgfZ